LTSPSSFIASLLGLVYATVLSLGSSHIYPAGPFLSPVSTTSPLHCLFLVVFPRALFWDPFSSSCILLRSAHSLAKRLPVTSPRSTIIFMLTTHNYSSLSHLTQPKLLLTVSMPHYPQYLSGWLPTFSLSIHQKLSFSSSVYQPNSLSFICQILHFLTIHQSHPWNQQEISDSSSAHTFLSTGTYLIFQMLATIISVTSDAYAQPWTSTLPTPSLHLWFILSMTSATLSLCYNLSQ